MTHFLNDNKLYFELGTRQVWGGTQPFGLSPVSLDQHVHVLGASGTGKSSLLRNLVLQLIQSGQGCMVVDPHGDLSREILECFPPERSNDLVVFNPGDEAHPVAFNVLADVNVADRARVAASVVGAFKAAFGDSWGPRLQRILHFSIASLLECQNVSLLAIPRLLVDSGYRERIVRCLRDPVLINFWRNEFEHLDKRFRGEIVDPVLNKLARWSVVPALRNVLGQVRNRIEPRFIMDNRRVVIANLSIGLLGEDAAALMGALLVAMFHASAMSRADTVESERARFTLVADEYPTYATDSFASILTQARKYKLQLVLACQHLRLTSEEIRAAVSGNVGTSISFRIGEADADVMSREFGSVYPPSMFTDLGNFEVLVKSATSSSVGEPFRGRTHPPQGIDHGRAESLLRYCRQRYATPRELVETRLLLWFRG